MQRVQDENNASTLLQFCVAALVILAKKLFFLKNNDSELIMTALDHFVVGKLHPYTVSVFENLKLVVTSFDAVHDRDWYAKEFTVVIKANLTLEGS